MTTAMTSAPTTYLQVPKFVPNGRSMARSKSRPTTPTALINCPSSPPPALSSPAPSNFSPRTRFPPFNVSSPTCTKCCTCKCRPTTTTRTSDPNGAPIAGFEPTPSGDRKVDMTDHEPAPWTRGYQTATPSPSPSPSPEPPERTPLRQLIVGTWRLESYIAYPTPTSPIQRPTYPMTKNVTGLILYTPDGYMSAQMLIPGQKSFKRGEGEENQWAEAGKRCFSYSGPYYISNEGNGREEVLRHTFQVCNLPGWIGDLQIRTWRFDEDGAVLVLSSEDPTEIKGDARIPVLKWRRAVDNHGKNPPAPMPQIKVSGPGEP